MNGMDEWMNGMNGMNERMKEWMNGMNEWTNGMKEWMNEMNERNEWTKWMKWNELWCGWEGWDGGMDVRAKEHKNAYIDRYLQEEEKKLKDREDELKKIQDDYDQKIKELQQALTAEIEVVIV